MKQNKGKGIVLAIILIVVAVVGISNLHFQSASSYKKSRTVYEGEDGHKIITVSYTHLTLPTKA